MYVKKKKTTGFAHTQICVYVCVYIHVCVHVCMYIVYILIVHTIYTEYVYSHIVYMNTQCLYIVCIHYVYVYTPTYIIYIYIYIYSVCIPTCVNIHGSMCAQSPNHLWLFVTPWTVAPPGSSVHGILQARILQWVAMPSSRASSPPKGWRWILLPLSHVGSRIYTHGPPRTQFW